MRDPISDASGSLRELWRESGPALTLARRARLARLHPSSLSRFERGERSPGLDQIGRVAAALNKLRAPQGLAEVTVGELSERFWSARQAARSRRLRRGRRAWSARPVVLLGGSGSVDPNGEEQRGAA